MASSGKSLVSLGLGSLICEGCRDSSSTTFTVLLLNHAIYENKTEKHTAPGMKRMCPNPAPSLARFFTVSSPVQLICKLGPQGLHPGGSGDG